ncbi:MAG: hypothetical protein ACOCX5_05815 [Chloroflexota bacterium]
MDDLQTDLIAAEGTVMGRGRSPPTLFERLPMFAKAVEPVAEMWSDEYDDNGEQKNVGDVRKFEHWHPPNEENLCQMLSRARRSSSPNYQRFT